jgi:hypothetical protein
MVQVTTALLVFGTVISDTPPGGPGPPPYPRGGIFIVVYPIPTADGGLLEDVHGLHGRGRLHAQRRQQRRHLGRAREGAV